MNVALILVSRTRHCYFEDMASCVEAVNQAKLPLAGRRSLNTWVQFVCVPAKPIVP
jgi:hypothetical protein